MSKIKIILFSLCLFIASAESTVDASVSRTASKEGSFGLGLILGEPTGLSAKYWFDKADAIDFGLAYSLNDYLLIYSDYLKHFTLRSARSSFVSHLSPYLGIGALAAIWAGGKQGDSRMGIRIPLGIEWTPSQVPIGVFAELAPGIYVLPGTDAFLNGGIGIRYYF